MLLKRLYDPADVAKLRDPNDPTERITPIGIKVLRAGPRQKFSPDLIAQGVAQGWLAIGDGKVTLKGDDGDVAYTITRSPCYYCCHCGMALEDAGAREEAGGLTRGQRHVLAEHGTAPSPDPNNPAGYEHLAAYDCVKKGA